MKKPRARKTLSEANLALLGPDRLAEILMIIADGQTGVKRWLRMELAAAAGADDLAVELGKRITAVAEARGNIHWRKLKEFIRELATLRLMVAGRLAPLDAPLALEMGVRLVALAGGVFDRVNDAKGEVAALFDAVIDDLAQIAPRAEPKGRALVDALYDAVLAGRGDMAKALITAVTPAMSRDDLTLLRGRIEVEAAPRRRINSGLRAAIQALADALGDVDGYIATLTESERLLPPYGAEVGRRLLNAGRAKEAAAALKASAPSAFTGGARGESRLGPAAASWEAVHIDTLEALGKADEAQTARWAAFETRLSAGRLRDYIKRLDDFDDVIAEDKALAYARDFKDVGAALAFFHQWPAVDEAANLVLRRGREIEGDDVDLLQGLARQLEARHPLAATLLLRTAVVDIINLSRADRYKEAQRFLLECGALAAQISEFTPYETHEAFAARLAPHHRW